MVSMEKAEGYKYKCKKEQYVLMFVPSTGKSGGKTKRTDVMIMYVNPILIWCCVSTVVKLRDREICKGRKNSQCYMSIQQLGIEQMVVHPTFCVLEHNLWQWEYRMIPLELQRKHSGLR